MYCALRVYDQQLDSAITLPSSLIQQDTRGNEFVYTLEPSGTNHIVKKHLITTGASAGDRTLILSGVQAGMNVVDKGARRVVEGQEVGLFNQQTAAAQ
jgi:multidrug efflux pump subunit AcrA (membrane-fusion protein)